MMQSGRIIVWIATAALAACAIPSAENVASRHANARSTIESKEGEQAHASLPGDACTLDGYWSFFEAFAQSAEVRQAYTDSNVRGAINPFRIMLLDHQWLYVESEQGQGKETLSLEETRFGSSFRVEYVRANFGPNDEVVKTHGKPGVYEFQFKDGCWRLTNWTE